MAGFRYITTAWSAIPDIIPSTGRQARMVLARHVRQSAIVRSMDAIQLLRMVCVTLVMPLRRWILQGHALPVRRSAVAKHAITDHMDARFARAARRNIVRRRASIVHSLVVKHVTKEAIAVRLARVGINGVELDACATLGTARHAIRTITDVARVQLDILQRHPVDVSFVGLKFQDACHVHKVPGNARNVNLGERYTRRHHVRHVMNR